MAELFCETVNLPGINIATTPQRIFGEDRQMPYEKIYDPVSMTFYVDTQMTIKTAFDRWIAMIINPDRRTVQYYNTYIRPIEIYIVSVDNQQPYKITLYEAYPKTIGSINLSSESREVMKLPITFQYKYWKVESTTLTASSILGSSAITANRQNVLVGPSVIDPSNLLFL
jgi:hypothetical protein